jgi:hypothetical protein
MLDGLHSRRFFFASSPVDSRTRPRCSCFILWAGGAPQRADVVIAPGKTLITGEHSQVERQIISDFKNVSHKDETKIFTTTDCRVQGFF